MIVRNGSSAIDGPPQTEPAPARSRDLANPPARTARMAPGTRRALRGHKIVRLPLPPGPASTPGVALSAARCRGRRCTGSSPARRARTTSLGTAEEGAADGENPALRNPEVSQTCLLAEWARRAELLITQAGRGLCDQPDPLWVYHERVTVRACFISGGGAIR